MSPYGSHLANARDRDALGNRSIPSGATNWTSRLTQEQASQIREAKAAGVSTAVLAKEFAVSTTTISNLLHGRTYRLSAS